jgi:hypothetical protein
MSDSSSARHKGVFASGTEDPLILNQNSVHVSGQLQVQATLHSSKFSRYRPKSAPGDPEG